jgi:4-diphosphocytidyl-2-C-methyl-D-erythritol kinase
VILRAPAKLNLCLYLSPRRSDGLHEIRSLFAPLSLSDRISVEEAEVDEVVCAGVDPKENLAARALDALRANGWTAPPVRIEIEKRIPVAAGLGGGSADAAAVLRLAGDEVEGIEEVAAQLGADVPSQLRPAFSLVAGAGERIAPLPPTREYAVVLVPADRPLRSAEVYAEADRIGLGRTPAELDEIDASLIEAAGDGASPLDYADMLVNDLQPAALSLAPEIGDAIEALERAGAARALVTGSGPTAFGLFADVPAADRGAVAIAPRFAGALIAAPDRFR